MSRDQYLVIGILVIIGLIVYGAGEAFRATAGQNSPRIPTVAMLPSAAPTLTPTATLPPTETPTVAPNATAAPEQPTIEPTIQPSNTDAPVEASPTPVTVAENPTETLVPQMAYAGVPTVAPVTLTADLGTPALTTMPGPAIGQPSPTPTEIPPTPVPVASPTTDPTIVTGTVQAEAGLTLRAIPNRGGQALAVLLRGVVVQVLARTEDNSWVRVNHKGKEGWVFAEYLQVKGKLDDIRVEAAPQATEIASGQNCISSVGDSIAYGEVIFEMPGVGYIKVKMAPFSKYLGDAAARRNLNVQATDRSYPGVGISSPQHTPYYNFPIYNDLLRDRCKFTVILPWVNDLSSGLDPAFSAADHISKLVDFVRRLTANNPRGRIVIANYYPGAPAPFSKNMAFGFTPLAIQLFNEQLTQSCTVGPLSQIPQVLCVDSNEAFKAMGTAYVVGPMQRNEIEAVMTRPLEPKEQEMLDYYVRTNPGQPLTGDGIHLSSPGKAALAGYILDQIATLPDIPETTSLKRTN